jgi:hypothetical protein
LPATRSTPRPSAVALLLAIVGLVLAAGASATDAAAASRKAHPRAVTCAVTSSAPGILSGTYRGNVSVKGLCDVDGGRATVDGNLTVLPGASLVAAYALNDRSHTGVSSLLVRHNLLVQAGASAILGCEPDQFECFDDPGQTKPTLSSTDIIDGSLQEQEPLGVVMHHGVVLGGITETGGGGDRGCASLGFFATIKYPTYSDYEDSTVHGNLVVRGLESCWLGITRVSLTGNMSIVDDQLAEPDAIEILSNKITGNLTCEGNSHVWDSTDYEKTLWPRAPEPDSVGGSRIGECVLASPAVEGGPLGPGPF